MKIAVLGSGAMGSLYGGMLTEAGQDVWLVDTWQEHVDRMRSAGLLLEGASGERVIRVKAAYDVAPVGQADLILVFVKSLHTEDAIRAALPAVAEHTNVLTLQNGLGNADVLAGVVGAGKVLAGVTYHGARVLGPGHVFHAGAGETRLGEFSGERTDRVQKIAELFDSAGLETTVSPNILEMIWNKLMINVTASPLSAITGFRLGEVLRHKETRELMQMLLQEAVGIGNATGLQLCYDDCLQKSMAVFRATAQNKPSMLVDIEQGRPTEIDFINGAVVRQAERLGLSAPYNKMASLLVKALEKRGTLS